jgi:hypothetical protein
VTSVVLAGSCLVIASLAICVATEFLSTTKFSIIIGFPAIVTSVHLHANHYSIKGNIIMKHKKMKDFTSIKSDDFESKAVDIVDGDNMGYPIAGNPIIIENFVVDKNSVATQIAKLPAKN